MNSYQYVKGIQPELASSYDEFTQRIFNFDLAGWREAGHWDDQYIPHVLVSGTKVIANIAAAIMKLQIQGREVPAVQLGAVGVLPDYRGQGLSRILMEAVIKEYGRFPLIFLFANQDVLDFYPKFGFRPIRESLPLINGCGGVLTQQPTKIFLGSVHLQRLLSKKLQRSSIIDARGNPSIYWFHLMHRFGENLYYIEDRGIVFIARYKDDAVDLYDVLSEQPVRFEEIRPYILRDGAAQVRFHFTPDWLDLSYDMAPDDDDSGLHVFGQFPRDMAKFRFPATAQT